MWAETHALPAPFSIGCEGHLFHCGPVLHRQVRAGLSGGGEREAWVQASLQDKLRYSLEMHGGRG